MSKGWRQLFARPPAIPDAAARRMAQPLDAADLAPAPAGSAPRPPDFVGVGCGKAGTSWWYRLVSAHPGVAPNRLGAKELQFFYHFGCDGIPSEAVALYHQAFAAPPGKLCGEWSPGYLTYPLALDYLAAAAPRTKILAIVRNPVDRIRSALNQMEAARIPALGLDAEAARLYAKHSAFPEAVAGGLLTSAFERLFACFTREQVLVLQYERCLADPAAELARTYRFLGLDATFVPPDLTRPVNRRAYTVTPLTPEQRKRLATYFAADVRRFAATYGLIDLALWPDFAPDGQAATKPGAPEDLR